MKQSILRITKESDNFYYLTVDSYFHGKYADLSTAIEKAEHKVKIYRGGQIVVDLSGKTV